MTVTTIADVDAQWDKPSRRQIDARPPQSFRFHLTCFCEAELRLRPRNGARTVCKECGAVARFANERVSLEAPPPKLEGVWQ